MTVDRILLDALKIRHQFGEQIVCPIYPEVAEAITDKLRSMEAKIKAADEMIRVWDNRELDMDKAVDAYRNAGNEENI